MLTDEELTNLFKWPDVSRDPTDDVEWLQKLVDILRLDLYEETSNGLETDFDLQPVGKLVLEFSGCCYLDHTMRLVKEHIQEYIKEVQNAKT
jgi:hypothetical protein